KQVLGNGPKGVLNTHAQALQFAWIMTEASELFGRSDDAKRWEAIFEVYRVGSKLLFQSLYPGARNCRTEHGALVDCDYVSGHVGYSIGNPCIYPGCDSPGAHPAYSFISFIGMAAGYLEAGDYEPEFVDAVERA